MKNVTVYSTPTCLWCHKAKDYLKMHNIEFKDVDVSIDRLGAMEMIRKSGQQGVPVIDIEGNIIVGFDQRSINKLLGI
jgi:glutaredoxin 3